jgi:hypothetical protein
VAADDQMGGWGWGVGGWGVGVVGGWGWGGPKTGSLLHKMLIFSRGSYTGKQEMGEMSLLRVEKNRFINILPCRHVNTVR